MWMVMAPPGRTSISHTGLVKPFGPHQRAICLGSVQALKTSARGAAKIRVRTSFGCSPLFLPSATLLLLRLHLLQIITEPVEPFLPAAPVLREPFVDVLQGAG